MCDKTLWTPTNIAWSAGLLEGEGSFGAKISRREKYDNSTQIRVECSMSDEDIITRLCEVAGFGAIFTENRDRRIKKNGGFCKTMYHWTGYGQDAYEFDLMLFPSLGYRRQQQVLDSFRLRKDYEIARPDTPGHSLKRIFTTADGRLLPNAT